MPCGVCGEDMERRDRFGFSGWAVHPRCALNTAEGVSDAGEDRFGIEVIGEARRPRRGAVHLVDFLPRLHMRIEGAANGSSGQQLRIARLREDVPPGRWRGERTRWRRAITRQTGNCGGG